MYAADAIDRDVYFGLPKDVAFCTRCVYSNQKPLAAKESGHTRNSKKSVVGFNEDGVCDACVAIESKKDIDWSEREEALIALCDLLLTSVVAVEDDGGDQRGGGRSVDPVLRDPLLEVTLLLEGGNGDLRGGLVLRHGG